jgi:hypothetical protein
MIAKMPSKLAKDERQSGKHPHQIISAVASSSKRKLEEY